MTKPIVRALSRCALLFAAFPLFLISLSIFSRLLETVYEHLYKYFPAVFPLYNPILESKQYERYHLTLCLIAILLSAFVSVYITLRYDNARAEYFISKTEGFYLVKDELITYLKVFSPSDAIASVVFGAIAVLPTGLIPGVFLRSANIIAELIRTLTYASGYIGDVKLGIFITLSFIASHLAAVPLALSAYRAKWLTGFV